LTGPPSEYKSLNPADDPLAALIRRFQQTWAQSGDADLAAFLPPRGSPSRLPALWRLVEADLEARFQKGRPLYLENYRERFPELAQPGGLPVRLLLVEYQTRRQYGDHPDLASYRVLFPDQFEAFSRLLTESVRTEEDGAARSEAPQTSPGTSRISLPPEKASQPAGASRSAPFRATIPGSPDTQILSGEGYVLLESIGRGQFGEVFRARAPGGVEVAIKCIRRSADDQLAERERESVELIRSLRHPFLLQTQAYWATDDELYIVLELAEGSLLDLFRESQAAGLPGIEPERLLPFFIEAAEALDYLHARHVLHRDIKPANLLHLGGHAKVADFGLARLLETQQAQATFCGTPLYMAPEIFRGFISVHSDQYGLALTYAEMRSGRRPFSGKNPFDLAKQHMEAPPDLSGLPEAEQQVVGRALAKDPEKRYTSCSAFTQALSRALTPPEPSPTQSPPSRWRLWVVALALVLGLSLGGAIVLYLPSPTPLPTPLPTPAPPPSQPEVSLPEGFERASDAQMVQGPNGRYYYTAIRHPLDNAPPLEFLLIRQQSADDPPTFYMQRDKVTCDQYRAVLKTSRMKDLLSGIEAKNPWLVPRMRERVIFPHDIKVAWGLACTPQGPAPLLAAPALVLDAALGPLPVTDVSVTEAHCFATAVGGRLPSARQWDKAGGGLEHPPVVGPFRPGHEKEIAIGLRWPRPAGTSAGDVSLFGCRDMAGNGKEYLRDLVNHPNAVVPLTDPTKEDLVLLRGGSFLRHDPFRFAALAKPWEKTAQEYGKPAFDIGFRVVLEVFATER
jgi:serine/threonine protein kinase